MENSDETTGAFGAAEAAARSLELAGRPFATVTTRRGACEWPGEFGRCVTYTDY